MIEFRPGVDDPWEFDAKWMQRLAARYASLLSSIRAEIEGAPWFDEELLEAFAVSSLDWGAAARQLFVGFGAAESLGRDPRDFLALWVDYSRTRILPISALNRVMDGCGNAPGYDPRTGVLPAALYNMAAELVGMHRFDRHAVNAAFREAYRVTLLRIVQCVFRDVASRFDADVLRDPRVALRTYDGPHSPLLRSGVMETLMLGLASMNDYRLHSTQWLQDYERTRQLLDDVADIRHDIGVGRVTLPVLWGLDSPKVGPRLARQIEETWRAGKGLGRNEMEDGAWEAAKELMGESGVLPRACAQACVWADSVLDAIRKEGLQGDTQTLTLHVHLKKACATRLLKSGFEDRAPPFAVGLPDAP